MAKYRVNRDKGYPVGGIVEPFGKVVELELGEATLGVGAGYLIPVDDKGDDIVPIVADPPVEERPFTKEEKASTLKK